MKCKKCNFDNPVPMKFCGQCGVELQVSPTLSEEKRLVTVLFADLSGFTRLSRALEPEEVSEVSSFCFERLNPIITRHRGVIHKYEGDLMIALFGLPVGHEDDPEQAVAAALELMAAVSGINKGLGRQLKKATSLSLHIGISSGTVAAGEIGSSEKKEYTVMGSVVNLAARIKDAARAEEILVSETVCRSTRYLFDFQAVTPVEMKGMEGTVRLYRPLGKKKKADPKRGINGLQSVMVGRDREFSFLKRAIDDVAMGKWGVISIVGPPGIGKTRLFDEIKRLIAVDRRPLSVLAASCLPDAGVQPDLPFLQILEQIFDIADHDPAPVVTEKLMKGLKELFDQDWKQHSPYLAFLFSGRLQNTAAFAEKIKQLDAKALRLQVLLGIRALLLELTKEHPVLLAIDDYHWIDPASLETIEFIVDGPEHGALLLLLLSRVEKEDAAWRAKEKIKQRAGPHFLEIVLGPLDDESTRQLAENLLRVPGIPEDFKAMVLEKSGGNPFFLEEILRHFIDQGALVHDRGSWRLEARQPFDVPDTIQAVVQARFGRLDADLRRLLQVSAVIGLEFEAPVLERVAELAPLESSLLLATLEEFEYIERSTVVPSGEGATYVFKHPLLQEVVYGTLFKKRRRELHERIARCIEMLREGRTTEFSEVLARQYYAAADFEKGLQYSLVSARKAADAYVNTASLQFYSWAIECAETTRSRQPLVVALKEKSLVLNRIGQNEAGLADIRRAITLAKKCEAKRLQAECLIRQSEIYEALSRHHQMATSAGEALLLYEALDDKKGIAESLNNIGASFFYLGDYEKAQEFHEKALTIRQALGDSDEEAISLVNIGTVLAARGDSRQGLEFYRRALAIAEATDNLRIQAASLNNIGFTADRLGENQRALDCYLRSLKIKEETGDRWGQATSMNNIGVVLGRLGESAGALTHFAKSLRIFEEIGGRRGQAVNLRSMAIIYLAQGDLARAKETLARATGLAQELADRELMRRVFVTSAEIELGEGNLAAMERCIEEARKLADELKSRSGLAEVLLLEARRAASRGDPTAQGEFEAAIDVFSDLAEAFELAKTLYYYRGYLIDRHQSVEAAAVGARAAALFQQVGAEGWLKRMADI